MRQKRALIRLQMVLARLAGVIRRVNRFKASSRADFAMRGFAISFLTLARVAYVNDRASFRLSVVPKLYPIMFDNKRIIALMGRNIGSALP